MGIKASVSLYSLQYQYLQGKMSLEDCIAFVKELGSDGIEILPDQMLHGTPEPTEETYEMWNGLGQQLPGFRRGSTRRDRTADEGYHSQTGLFCPGIFESPGKHSDRFRRRVYPDPGRKRELVSALQPFCAV